MRLNVNYINEDLTNKKEEVSSIMSIPYKSGLMVYISGILFQGYREKLSVEEILDKIPHKTRLELEEKLAQIKPEEIVDYILQMEYERAYLERNAITSDYKLEVSMMQSKILKYLIFALVVALVGGAGILFSLLDSAMFEEFKITLEEIFRIMGN